MSDTPQAQEAGLMSIGSVAAHNIAAFLNLDAKHVGAIEQAIKDEINAMSSHFTLAIADVQTQYEVEIKKAKTDYDEAVALIKSDYVWIEANALKVGLVLTGVFTFSMLFGKFVV